MSKDTFYDEDNEIIDFLLEENSENDIRNWAQFFGFKNNGDSEENKKTFRRQSRKTHPDLNPNDPNAEKQFKKLNTAYEYIKKKGDYREREQEYQRREQEYQRREQEYQRREQERQRREQERQRREQESQRREQERQRREEKERQRRKEKADWHFNKYNDYKKSSKKESEQYKKETDKQSKKYLAGQVGLLGLSAVSAGSAINVNLYRSKRPSDIKKIKQRYNKYLEQCIKKNKKPLTFNEWKNKKIKIYSALGVGGSVASLAGLAGLNKWNDSKTKKINKHARDADFYDKMANRHFNQYYRNSY